MGHGEMVEIGDDGTLERRYARIWCEIPFIVDLALHGHARTPLLVTRQSYPLRSLNLPSSPLSLTTITRPPSSP